MKTPDHRSELHTQMLFGDLAVLTDTYLKSWIMIRTLGGETAGWVLRSQLAEADPAQADTTTWLIRGNRSLYQSAGYRIPLLCGSRLSEITDQKQLISDELIHADTIRWNADFNRSILQSFLHAPYMWGGTSCYGIDCSGLSKILYKFHGLPLPHLAAAQMQYGEVLDFLPNARCGDLAFFENEAGEINHVGIMLNDREIIHASETNGCVLIDDIDQQGIINRNMGKRTHTLRLIKRLREFAE